MKVRNLLAVCMVFLAMAACSSDDPTVDNGGNGNNGGTGTIPASQLAGQWNYESFHYDLKVEDAEVRKFIKNFYENEGSIYTHPKTGRLKFVPGDITTSFPDVEFEGNLYRNWADVNGTLQEYGNYYTKGDSIFCATGYRWVIFVKTGNQMTYIYDLTKNDQEKYPNAGVKKSIYYAVFKKV